MLSLVAGSAATVEHALLAKAADTRLSQSRPIADCQVAICFDAHRTACPRLCDSIVSQRIGRQALQTAVYLQTVIEAEFKLTDALFDPPYPGDRSNNYVGSTAICGGPNGKYLSTAFDAALNSIVPNVMPPTAGVSTLSFHTALAIMYAYTLQLCIMTAYASE